MDWDAVNYANYTRVSQHQFKPGRIPYAYTAAVTHNSGAIICGHIAHQMDAIDDAMAHMRQEIKQRHLVYGSLSSLIENGRTFHDVRNDPVIWATLTAYDHHRQQLEQIDPSYLALHHAHSLLKQQWEHISSSCQQALFTIGMAGGDTYRHQPRAPNYRGGIYDGNPPAHLLLGDIPPPPAVLRTGVTATSTRVAYEHTRTTTDNALWLMTFLRLKQQQQQH